MNACFTKFMENEDFEETVQGFDFQYFGSQINLPFHSALHI